MSEAHPLEDRSLVKLYRFGPARVRGSWSLLLEACQMIGWTGGLNGALSGARTYAMQSKLWLLYKAGRGAPAFPPWSNVGRHLTRNTRRKNHWRQAIDAYGVKQLISKADKLGVKLHTPVPGEPWHVEAVEHFDARAVLRKAKRMRERVNK